MNKTLSGTLIAWRTGNARRHKRMEVWCADYGLRQIHKALHLGMLYENERQALEKKCKTLLTGKRDRHCIITLCAGCIKGLETIYKIEQNKMPYEIV